MFGNWSTLLVANGQDNPLSRIFKYKGPLTFPGYGPFTDSSDPTFSQLPEDEQSFYTFFAKIKRATDVTRQHLDLLNVSVSHNVPVQELVGGGEWVPTEENDATYAERKRELLIENHTANEVMARIRRDLKLGHMYKFFQCLEMILPYYGTPEECAAWEEEQKKGSSSTVVTVRDADRMEIDGGGMESNDNGKRPASAEMGGSVKRDRWSPENEEGVKKEEKFSMPERFRDDLVKNFVEPICWGYGVRIYPPRMTPKMHLQRSKFSVHLNYHIHLTPLNPQEARAGIVVGPVLGMQIRHEHAFRVFDNPDAALKKRRKKLMAAALASKVPPTAEEEAARKKKAEKEKARAERHARRASRPSSSSSSRKDKDEEKEAQIEGEMKEDDVEDLGDEGILVTGPDGTPQDLLGVTREVVALMHLAQLRAREGEEERKVRYIPVGKEPGSYWDDVYLITAIHHHISISRLRVSKPYLRFIKTGKLPKQDHPFIKEGGWEKLHLQKTRYWSLIDPTERAEAARALVAVLKWQGRNEGLKK